MFPFESTNGPLRFDRFMAAALHDPERGYYSRRIRGVGRRGDFSTTATLTAALGPAVAGWSRAALRATRCRDLVELGPGDGSLAAAVLDAIPRLRRPRLHLVETSAPLREAQQQALARHRRRVAWHPTAAAALDAAGGAACLYSNEFVDAFPVRRLRRAAGGWEELHLDPPAKGQATPVERWLPLLPPDELPDSSLLDPGLPHLDSLPDGQVVEVHASFRDWIHETLPHWRRGRMLTIDYGAPADRLLHRRPGGTLRGYFHHQLVTGPELHQRAGHQDLTADVNFTDLSRWAEPWAATLKRESQREFLAAHLDPASAVDRQLADPAGAGGAFLVLHLEAREARDSG